jgi:hypothetical protein
VPGLPHAAQDQTYPWADHRAPLDAIEVRYRKTGFVRHELLGLNAFLLRTFQTNSDALGVRLNDYMSGSSTDLDDAIGNVVRQAQHKTATVDLVARVENGTLLATVGVTNQTGHRFPSGVGFRRAWIELKVTDADGNAVWASGMTNANGEIVDGTDTSKVLPTEYFTRGRDGKQRYQKHFTQRRPVTRGDQVQIFEELVKDHEGNFTLSFIRRDSHAKDNRLLPPRRTAGDPAAEELARRDAPRGRVRRQRPELRERQRPRRHRVPRPAAHRARPVQAARRGDAVVSGLGTGVPARAHERHRPRRAALPRPARQPQPCRHADEGLEAAHRLGDGVLVEKKRPGDASPGRFVNRGSVIAQR